MSVKVEPFGKLDDGTVIEQFTLENKNGMVVQIISYGAAIRTTLVPDGKGSTVDVALGFDDLDGYLGKQGKNPYFGAVVGRAANRIANGTFALDGKTYKLAQNNGPNALHGGIIGFDKVAWKGAVNKDSSVTFSYLAKDGEEGFPGNLIVNATYSLGEDNGLKLQINAMTDQATPVNIVNHSFFNLAGHAAGAEAIGEHWATFNCDQYLPVNSVQIPTGIKDVGGTVFDLRVPRKMADQLPNCPGGPDFNGYDHCFCINQTGSNKLKFVCRFEHRPSGRSLECFTDQPGIQFYSGNFMPKDEALQGKGGNFYKKHGGFALESQMFPDAINQSFPHDTILRPGQIYDHVVIYKFN